VPAVHTATDPVIVFDHVKHATRRGFLRRPEPLFDDLSFAVDAGEAVGVLLRPGTGKTALVKLATGGWTSSAGAVSVLGLPPSGEPGRVTGRIGVVVQERIRWWQDIPLEDALRMLADRHGMTPSTSEPRLVELLQRLELTRFARTPVGELSVGRRRRTELAAALLPDPDILVLDDPTRGADPGSKERLRSVLRQEHRLRGRTVLVATSDLMDIEALCPRMLVLADGRVGFDGAVTALNERLGTERVLVVDLVEPADPIDDLPGTELIAVEAGGMRQHLGIAPGRASTRTVLAQVLARATVRNLTLQEPDVGELVSRLSR